MAEEPAHRRDAGKTKLSSGDTQTGSLDEYLLDQSRLEARVDGALPREVSWAAVRLGLREKITRLVESIVESVGMGRLPTLSINTDSWSSVNVDTGVLRSDNSSQRYCDLGTVGKVERFARLMVVLKIVYGLLVRNEVSTVRQIFYDNVKRFENQINVHRLLNDITKILDCSRRDLNVISTAKGLVSGDLRWLLKGCDKWIDCRSAPVLIPNDFRDIREMKSSANIVLIVEKDAIFQKLLDQDACAFLGSHNLNVVLITGKGVPDLNTRQLVHILFKLTVPDARFFVLTDADAYGIEIAAIYSFGSLAQAYAENHGVPKINWIGLLPSEIESFNMRPESRIPSALTHQKRLQNLLERPWMKFRPQWRREVLKLISLECKAEIQALDQFGHTFLLKNYICSKLLKAAHSLDSEEPILESETFYRSD